MGESERSPDPRSGLTEAGDWVPAFEGQRPPFESGNELAADAPVTHGAYAKRRLLEAAEAEYARLRETFVPWDDAFELPARTLAEIRARTVLAYVWLDEHDLVDDRAEVRAILRELPRWERRATELYRELALTVRSRVELDLDRIARDRGLIELAEAKQMIDAWRQATLDAVRSAEMTADQRGTFLRVLEERVAQLLGSEGDVASGGGVEGSARRLGPAAEEEESGGGA